MDRFLTKKRSADDEVEVIDQPAKKKAVAGDGAASSSEEAAAGGAGEPAARPIFIIAPGASGGDCKELAEVLSRLGTVRGVAKWAGNFPGQMPANVALLRAKIEEAAATLGGGGGEGAPPRRVVVVGHSFGCRVAVALMLQHADGTGPPLPEGFCGDRAVLESYPLYGPSAPSKGTDRVAPLRALPAGARLLFVSGAGDEFLQRGGPRGWRTGGPFGVAALQEVVDSLACRPTCAVLPVEGARHNSLKVAKKSQLAVEGRFVAAVKRFLAAE